MALISNQKACKAVSAVMARAELAKRLEAPSLPVTRLSISLIRALTTSIIASIATPAATVAPKPLASMSPPSLFLLAYLSMVEEALSRTLNKATSVGFELVIWYLKPQIPVVVFMALPLSYFSGSEEG